MRAAQSHARRRAPVARRLPRVEARKRRAVDDTSEAELRVSRGFALRGLAPRAAKKNLILLLAKICSGELRRKAEEQACTNEDVGDSGMTRLRFATIAKSLPFLPESPRTRQVERASVASCPHDHAAVPRRDDGGVVASVTTAVAPGSKYPREERRTFGRLR